MCVFVATLVEILSTVTVTFDEQVDSGAHVIIHLASFHYIYRFLILCTFFAKRATKEVDMVISVVCTSVRPAVSRFPYILPQENLDGLR
jgi:cytochrome bd-type quinol oxidase subunit 2